ncbi:VWA domain-containing protein [Trichlorobacter lovleyi]|uniref:VWA domain-containing protein n=1 Tax=Trichlorobacter lovleyi TaxID=313985 RepID=UPI00224034B7|nr:VWA domain-containing protein [Trichlorobacter lovleyi]QOX78643.1 VWA domain-containing protein [Trichlorobacter lovleyi]
MRKAKPLIILFFFIAAILMQRELVSAQSVIHLSSTLSGKSGGESTKLESLKVGEKVTLKHRIYSEPVKLSRPPEETDKAIILILDTSRSMGWRMTCDECYPSSPEKNRMQIMQDAARSFVASFMGKQASIILAPFSQTVYGNFQIFDLQEKSGYSVRQLQERISALKVDGNTNTGAALRKAAQLLQNFPEDTARFVVLMTDGMPNNLNDTLQAAVQLREKNINGYAVSITDVGSSIEQIALAMGARETQNGQHYYKALSEADMQEIYRQVLADIDAIITFKNVVYQELLPQPVKVRSVKVVDAQMKPTADHLKVSQRPDGSNIIDGGLRLKMRKGTAGTHVLDEQYLLIDLIFNDIGAISDHTPQQLSYLDPFGVHQQALIDNNVTIAADDFDLMKLAVKPVKLTIKRNQTGNCGTVFTPAKIRNRKVEWSVEDTSLVAITVSNDENLQLKGLKVGKTRIVARHLASGKTATAELEVLPFSIDKKKLFDEDEPPRRTVDKLVMY